ncbi:MAG: type IX secretion system sortase PorU [Prevotella sp.]|nr:type IX secretion system sortase PorU [Prevotella sp.]
MQQETLTTYLGCVAKKVLLFCLFVLLPFCSLQAQSTRFFNLTAPEVRIDSLLPVFNYAVPLGYGYADSVYTVSILYPEFIPMRRADIARVQVLSSEPLPQLPTIARSISVSRKQGSLDVSFIPLVCRDGQYQKLVSFMLRVDAFPRVASPASPRRAPSAATRAGGAAHSVLASGTWAKIRVPQSGVYQLTDALIRRAGFTDINKVKVYGYGGGLQPEQLSQQYLQATDDLQEVPTCTVGGRRLFYAVGPVTWSSTNRRVRNPYSDYGYYFLTESDDAPQTLESDAFLASFYPSADDYNTLYEVDDYAWFHGGRNLYDAQPFTAGQLRSYTLHTSGRSSVGTLTVVLTADAATTAQVSINGSPVGTMSIAKPGTYDAMRVSTGTFTVDNLQTDNVVTITEQSGGTMRLDYISIYCSEPFPAPDLAAGTFSTPEFVERVANQDHHADEAADMIIVIPTSQKLLAQAERLQTLHREHDGLRVRIVPAGELYNEFSSGTPDANAYRRYLKMLYDRAESDADMPRFLLLFGDGAWDNRMRAPDWAGYSPDDFLLCYESENSYSKTDCYVSDDFFCLLDDGEGADMLASDKADVAVGRFPVRTADEAQTLVDKVVSYVGNQNAGAWQNLVCVMGDDGNNNNHMDDANAVAEMVEANYPNLQVKRIMWDAYTRVSSSTGNSYPDVTRLIKQQMTAGALMMNYAGHGAAYSISHENVLSLDDFKTAVSPRLPIWVTASCDIMPFDGQEENIGEQTLLNKRGGAVAFYGTTRTVYQNYNRVMNLAFTRYVLGTVDGRRTAIGEAVRLAKNSLINNISGAPKDLTANKLQYSLLGDPALVLAMPTLSAVVDSINGVAVADGRIATLNAGATATVCGHVENADGQLYADFNGVVTATVRDVLERITCKLNDQTKDGADEAFVYYDRPKTLFNGSDSIRSGRFTFSFAVPKDISYSSETGLINLYAVNNDRTEEASGISEGFTFGSSSALDRDSIGPSIYCYLNSSSFSNGDNVNPTPYFIAEVSDEDGINATGNGIGHDLQLIIDGDMAQTYDLNGSFVYDFGSYTRGTVGFSIPQLSYGRHHLLFRAWDILNNSSTAELDFNVVQGLQPLFFDVECTRNPATTTTSFRIIHDRVESSLDVVLDVFDISGRHLWQYAESGISSDNTYTVDWDLSVDGGRRLPTGLYLYRLRLRSDGSTYVSKAKKLIVISNK